MLNLGAYRPLPQNHYCYHKLFLHCIHFSQTKIKLGKSELLHPLNSLL